MSSITFSRGKEEVTFGVTKIPYRINQALYVMRGAHLEVLAYFRNDDVASEFDRILDYITEMYAKGRSKQ